MTTAKFLPQDLNYRSYTCEKKQLAEKQEFAPEGKTTRQIVREEIQRQKKLDALETKYQNGEISKFEYNVQKAMLNIPNLIETPQTMHVNCVA